MAKEYDEHELKLQAQAVALLMDAFKDEDEETKDIVIESETNFVEAVTSIIRSLDDDKLLLAGIKDRTDELSLRKSRITSRTERKRAALELAFQVAEIKGSLETPLGTVTLKKGTPKLNITDESDIPTTFFNTPDPVLDKKALLQAIKDFVEQKKALVDAGDTEAAEALEDPAPGASLSNAAPSIQIRVK